MRPAVSPGPRGGGRSDGPLRGPSRAAGESLRPPAAPGRGREGAKDRTVGGATGPRRAGPGLGPRPERAVTPPLREAPGMAASSRLGGRGGPGVFHGPPPPPRQRGPNGAPASGPGVGEVGGAGGGVLRRGGCCGDWGVETRAVWACPCRPRSPGRWSFSLGGRAGVGAGVRGGGSRVGTWLRPGLNGGCFHPLAASPPGGGRAAAGPLARGWQGSGGAHEGGLESIDLMRNAGGEVAPFGHA